LSDDQTQRSETNPQVTATESASDGPLELIELYARMALIRAFETRVSELYRDGEIPGFVHTSLGQEAVAVGVCAALRDDDYLATTHRGHGHCLAKGADVDGMMAELFAKQTGLCRGKGGSMHVADPARGILGANAIVGASIPLAVGAGLTSKLLALGRVAVAFFGEGAANQGAFHEAVNLAAIWSLPVLFVCENNVYSEFSDSRSMSRLPSIAERTKAYGIDATVVDGNDVTVVRDESLSAVSRCRAGDGPVLLEAETYRWQGRGRRPALQAGRRIGLLEAARPARTCSSPPVGRASRFRRPTGCVGIRRAEHSRRGRRTCARRSRPAA
jgi:TPP-dependent pyruvate/acetoin dehydrogenase alpha subunit